MKEEANKNYEGQRKISFFHDSLEENIMAGRREMIINVPTHLYANWYRERSVSRKFAVLASEGELFIGFWK